MRVSIANVPLVRDARTLPYPLHGKHAHSIHLSTGRALWSWDSWRGWLAQAVARRKWRKTAMQKMLQLRAAEAQARGDPTDYYSPDVVMNRHGAIYAAYHFPTGKWYVGQTINTVPHRARQHWYSRRTDKDFLHLTLADDPDPMCWISLPVEYIPKEEWEESTPKGAKYRDREPPGGNHPGEVLDAQAQLLVAHWVELPISGQTGRLMDQPQSDCPTADPRSRQGCAGCAERQDDV